MAKRIRVIQPSERMHMKIKAIGIALLLSHSLSYGMVTIIGNKDCGEWFKLEGPKVWLMGYLSGLNVMVAEDKKNDPLGNLNSAEQAILWMDNYCKANPLTTVADGAQKLYIELAQKK